jgi:hypothetical protein
MTVKLKTSIQIGTLYNEGEIVSFDAATEKDLIAREIAEPVKAKGGKPDTPPPPPPPAE